MSEATTPTTPTAAPAAVYNRGIASLIFNNKVIGYVKKSSFKLNGKKAEYVALEAEQVPGAPVEYIITKPASIEPEFVIIQTDYQTLYDNIGGELIYSGEGDDRKIVGWNAPMGFEVPKGSFYLNFYTGKVQAVHDAVLFAATDGVVSFGSSVEVPCQLLPIKSLSATQKAVYGIYDSIEIAKSSSSVTASSSQGNDPTV